MSLSRKQIAFWFVLIMLVGGSVGVGYRLLWAKGHAQATPVANCTSNRVNFDLVYVRAPRYGDNQNAQWLDTVRTTAPDPGADLRLLHPNCTEELLFPLPGHRNLVDRPLGNGSVQDSNISFDGQWVVFAYYHDMSEAATNYQRCQSDRCLSLYGADIYRLNLLTREVVRLTRQEFTPNTGNGADFRNCAAHTGENCPGVGVFNINPAFVATSDPTQPKIAFVSSRNNFVALGTDHSHRALQLFTMDWQGQNVEQIGYLNNFQALHPFQLVDGRLLFTTWEAQGGHDTRLFPLWFIGPDGTQWNSGSGFGEGETVHHFMTQMSDGDIVVVRYYNQNNNGFGDLARYPLPNSGHDIFRGIDEAGTYMPFQRPGQVNLTNWTDEPYSLAGDWPAPCAVGNNIYNDSNNPCNSRTRIGKVTHPAVAPGDDLLLVYSPGPANHNGIYVGQGSALPFYDGGIYVMNRTQAAAGTALPSDLQPILNHPNYNEQWPRPVVAYSALFPGRTQPAIWPEYQNRGEAEHNLAPDTPFGLIGSASLIHRDTKPRNAGYHQNADGSTDPDPFNASHEALLAWRAQGADAGLYTDNDIYAIRLLALLPSTDRTYPDNTLGWYNIGAERIRILGEIPVRHEGVQDALGNVDTSFLARIPADTPFTFQTLDRNGMVLNMAQTWHQVRPGEARYDCGGCHAHAQTPMNFAATVAGQPGYQPVDLALQTPLLQLAALNGNPTVTNNPMRSTTVEYKRDILPILQTKCAGCHTADTADGRLNLHDDSQRLACTNNRWPGTYYRLVMDDYSNADCRFGLGVPPESIDYFIYPQRTRYLRTYQARQSLLIWKLFGARLDGRTNATRSGDIDFTPDALHTDRLSWDEKLTFARWVDLGAPINYPAPNTIGNGNAFWGWFEDDLRPTLWVGPTLSQAAAGATNSITVAAYDLESDLANNSLSVILNIPVGGQAAGTNFATGINPANGAAVTVPLPTAINLAASRAVLTVSIRDSAGHTTIVVRSYGIGGATNPTATPTPSPTTQPTNQPTPTLTPTPPTATTTPMPGLNVKINFQPANAPVAVGYLVDSGQIFGNRGNGYSYGWSGNNTRMTYDRNSSRSPDQRYDTLLFMQKVGPYFWEIALPNGAYTVRIVAGDPNQTNSTYRISAENTLVVNGKPTSSARWVEGVTTVQVTDGRLTLRSANGAKNNKIAFLEISSAAQSAQRAADSSPADEDPPTATILTINAIDNQAVQLEWTTGEEVDTGGFYLYRSTTGERVDAVPITHNLIPKKNGIGGASYILIDANVMPGVYTYWLVEQESAQTEAESTEETFEYDPVAVAIGFTEQIYLPLVNK